MQELNEEIKEQMINDAIAFYLGAEAPDQEDVRRLIVALVNHDIETVMKLNEEYDVSYLKI